MPPPPSQTELSVSCQAGKCSRAILFSPHIHSLSQTGRKLGEVTPELCDPEQQPWAMGHSCLPSLPGPDGLWGARAASALWLFVACLTQGKKVENVSFFEKK